MKLSQLKELTQLSASKKQISEMRSNSDLAELVQKYMDQEKIYSMEGSSGVRNLLKLVHVLDNNYSDLDSFFEDNPGALEAIVEWIEKARVSEWAENLAAELPEGEEE